ncbi:melanoregulin [Aplochiton taeniatus]
MQPTRPTKPSEASVSSDSDPEQEDLFGLPKERNPWMSPRTSGGDVESDGELQAFISMRNQADQDTEVWEKLNYDIHTLRCARREISTRWKKILLQLGYQCEVDSLLCVTRQSQLESREEQGRAKVLLQTLLDHTSLLPPGVGLQERYLHVMDRLVALDSADDFIRLAKEKYPKKDC